MKSEKNHRYMLKYPAWAAGIFDNRIRSLIHNSNVLFGDYVSNGDTVIDIGIGGGILYHWSCESRRRVWNGGLSGFPTGIDR